MKTTRMPRQQLGGNGTTDSDARREITHVMRLLKTTNPSGYRAFVRLIREVEKISSK